MDDPLVSRFKDLIRSHAASRDVHDVDSDAGFANRRGAVSDAFVQREVDRVSLHARSLVPLLAKVGRARAVLDYGCGTGGSTLALALARPLAPERVVGVDVNAAAIEAARVRAASYGLDRPAVELHAVDGGPLRFRDGEFDLAVTVSVLEFITREEDRRRVVAELARVVRPGGHLFIATPRPWIREYHSRRWLGDLRREPGFPWSSATRQLRRWLPGWELLPLHDELARVARGTRLGRVSDVSLVRRALPYATRWSKLLLRRPGPAPSAAVTH